MSVLLVCVAAACGMLGLGGCDSKSSTAGSGGSAAPAEPAAGPRYRYTVRGRVKSLPEPGKPMSSFEVHHEAIDNFVRADGKLGMGAMTMDFPLGEGVSLQGLRVGDIVEMVLEVQPRPRMRMKVTKLTTLPPETKLEFRAARPVDGDSGTK